MDKRIETLAEGQIPLVFSPGLPATFCHGFTTRYGGVSAPPFASLNLGWKWGDSSLAVDENHRRLLAISGAEVMVRTSQVHGVRILRVRAGDDPLALANEMADGLVTNDPRIGISVQEPSHHTATIDRRIHLAGHCRPRFACPFASATHLACPLRSVTTTGHSYPPRTLVRSP